MRTYSFISSCTQKHYYQTAFYDRKIPQDTKIYTIRMSPSQRDGFYFISEKHILRHSALILSKFAPTVPVLDIRHCRLHIVLSAVHDLYKFASIMTKRDCDDEKTKKLFLDTKKRIAKFLRRLTRRLPPKLNRITNKWTKRRFKDTLQTHLPLLILRLLKRSKFLGLLLTVFMDIKYRLPAVASLVAALERDGSARFPNGVRILVMSTRNSHCDWDIPGVDPYLKGLSTLKPEYC